jgi:2-polyprenyl-3-methyl-5-hydroxy-6-metoxy-1,4-benzoquinol methylase
MQLQFAMAGTQVLGTACRFEFFTRIHEGKTTAAAIAQAAKTNERGTAMILDALCPFGLISKKDGKYGLTPVSDEFLVKTKPTYVHFDADHFWKSWGQLPEVVATGKPLTKVESKEVAEAFFPQLVRALHIIGREPGKKAAAIAGKGKTGLQVLDIAAGSAVWSIPFAEQDKTARVTAQDFPKVLETTKEFVAKHGVNQQFDYLPGDLKSVDLGKERFDVATLGNIVHSEGEKSSRDLFKRLHAALKPGGQVVVVDMIPNDERTGPPFPLIFALNMLLHTEVGSTYTLAEYKAWFKDAGFSRVETHDIGIHSPLVVAHR